MTVFSTRSIGALAIVTALSLPSISSTQFWYYPQIDQSSWWGNADWTDGLLYNAQGKYIKVDANTTALRSVFSTVWMQAIRVNGVYYDWWGGQWRLHNGEPRQDHQHILWLRGLLRLL
jgi:hypothetical protein